MARLRKAWIRSLTVSKNLELQECVYKYELPSFPEAEIGVLEITRKNGIIARAYLDQRLRKHGLGMLLYEIALHDTGSISTQYLDASEMAQRVWHSLIKNYRYKEDFWTGILTCTVPKKLRLTTDDLLSQWKQKNDGS